MLKILTAMIAVIVVALVIMDYEYGTGMIGNPLSRPTTGLHSNEEVSCHPYGVRIGYVEGKTLEDASGNVLVFCVDNTGVIKKAVFMNTDQGPK